MPCPQFHVPGSAKTPDPLEVFFAVRSHLVVEVGRTKPFFGKPRPESQEMQENGGVDPAGKGYEDLFSRPGQLPPPEVPGETGPQGIIRSSAAPAHSVTRA